MTSLVLQVLYAAARSGMRERSKATGAAIRGGDAAPYPWIAVNDRLWNAVHDVGDALL